MSSKSVPEIGALTEFLAENATEVMAFEVDRLVPILARYLCVILIM